MLLTHEDSSDSSSPALSAGQLLKKARQAKGVHLAVLAVKLKVPVRQLEALEADQYDSIKGGTTFLRAITSAMCRHLGIDAAPALALLPAAVSSMGTARPALEPLSGLQRVSLRPRQLNLSARPVVILAILMLLGTAAFLWLPAPGTWWPDGAVNDAAPASVEEAAVPLGQASNPESTEDAAAAASSPASFAAPVASGPIAATPVNAASAASLRAAPATAAASNSSAVLRLEASADTWVEVRDAQGQQKNKLLKAGESLEVNPPTPYNVVIGRAAAVKVTLRGQPFDLKPYAPQSVARFEVKE
jgi:cytoskeleton protein RodZ